MPKLKCANCGQKKSEFVVCASCGTRYCSDCLMEAARSWPEVVKTLPPDIAHGSLYKLGRLFRRAHEKEIIRGCCMSRAELYVIKHLALEELPLYMNYPWLSKNAEKALRRRFETG